MEDVIEVKVKYIGDYRNWEIVPVAFEVKISDDYNARNFAHELSQLASMKFIREVRWNHKGSNQGHYVLNLFG